jgi:hypothetical protein
MEEQQRYTRAADKQTMMPLYTRTPTNQTPFCGGGMILKK